MDKTNIKELLIKIIRSDSKYKEEYESIVYAYLKCFVDANDKHYPEYMYYIKSMGDYFNIFIYYIDVLDGISNVYLKNLYNFLAEAHLGLSANRPVSPKLKMMVDFFHTEERRRRRTGPKNWSVVGQVCQLRGYKFGKVLGAGVYGQVVIACKDEKCDYVAKIQKLDEDVSEFINEVMMFKFLKGSGIVPDMYDYWTCVENGVKYGIIIMEKMDGTLNKLIESYQKVDRPIPKSEWFAKIDKKVEELRKRHISHNDLHSGNILYKIDGGRIEFKIGDLGLACMYDEDYVCKNTNEMIRPYEDADKIFSYIYRGGRLEKAKTGKRYRKRGIGFKSDK